jgi:hypothetical protein
MPTLTSDEYEARRRRLEADAADAKKTLQNARARYEQICEELRNLRIDWQEQQRTADKAQKR